MSPAGPMRPLQQACRLLTGPWPVRLPLVRSADGAPLSHVEFGGCFSVHNVQGYIGIHSLFIALRIDADFVIERSSTTLN